MAETLAEAVTVALRSVKDPATGRDVVSAGMVQGLIHDIPTCQVLIDRIIGDAESIIKGRLGAMLG